MATGDNQDIQARIRAQLPPWFGNGSHPIVDALIAGMAAGLANLYALYAYAVQQCRIKTATGGWLDMIAADFFGIGLLRNANESDVPFRTRILAALLREKATRAAMYATLLALTGRAPRIIEPMRPADTGAYSQPNSGYSTAGGYGSMLVPYQAFIEVFRPNGSGIPIVGGYGLANYGATNGGPGGYGMAALKYADITDIQWAVTDAQILAAIESVRPAGTEAWVAIST